MFLLPSFSLCVHPLLLFKYCETVVWKLFARSINVYYLFFRSDFSTLIAVLLVFCVCLFFHWTFSLLVQCHNVFADPCFALHVRELFSPTGSDSVSSWSAGRLTRSVKSDCNFPCPAFRLCHDQRQPPSIPASPLDHRLRK